jgi:hypothetical protein
VPSTTKVTDPLAGTEVDVLSCATALLPETLSAIVAIAATGAADDVVVVTELLGVEFVTLPTDSRVPELLDGPQATSAAPRTTTDTAAVIRVLKPDIS